MPDTLNRALDQHLKQPVLTCKCLQKPLTDHRWLRILRQQQVRPVLNQHFLFGVDKSFQQEWRPWDLIKVDQNTSNEAPTFLVVHPFLVRYKKNLQFSFLRVSKPFIMAAA